VNGLHLVGYTADLEYLVFDDAGDGSTRHRVPIDEDLLATLREIAELLGPADARQGRAAGASKGRVVEDDPEVLGQESAPGLDSPPALAGVGVLQTLTTAAAGEATAANGREPAPSRTPKSLLSPREIQALLRAGVPPRTVARQADTDEAWVVRWLAPIEAERRRVLEAVRGGRVSKARLGPSGDLLGDAVDRNLLAKGVQPTSETVEWIVTRREGDPAWTVTLRYRSRGRAQRAVWRFDPERRELEPRGALAVELAWTRPRTAAPPADETAPQETPAAKGAARSSAAAKKTAKKTVTKTAKRAAATGKAAVGKATAGKKTAGKASAPKAVAAKAAAAKATATGKSSASGRRTGRAKPVPEPAPGAQGRRSPRTARAARGAPG